MKQQGAKQLVQYRKLGLLSAHFVISSFLVLLLAIKRTRLCRRLRLCSTQIQRSGEKPWRFRVLQSFTVQVTSQDILPQCPRKNLENSLGTWPTIVPDFIRLGDRAHFLHLLVSLPSLVTGYLVHMVPMLSRPLLPHLPWSPTSIDRLVNSERS